MDDRLPTVATPAGAADDGRGRIIGDYWRLLRWAPAVAVLVALGLAIAFGVEDYLSLGAIRQYREVLNGLVGRNPVIAAIAYMLAYVAAVAVSVPGASVLTAAGGLMFGGVIGAALALVSATLGACIVFLIARTSIGDLLARRAGSRMRRLRAGFSDNGFSYLLSIRLVPLFPFWLVNLAAALVGMRLAPYAAATALGILPGTAVFAYFGQGLGAAIDQTATGREPSMPAWPLALPLFLLALLALVPVLVRQWSTPGGHE